MKQEILEIIKQGESERAEFKKSFSDEAIISLVAMTNFKGGKVLLGVDNQGKITGVKINKESLQKWTNEVKNKTQPYLNVDVYKISLENKIIVVLEILEFPLKPVSFKNRYYLRRNNSNHILSLKEVAGGFDAIVYSKELEQKSSEKILEIIKNKPEISAQEIANIIIISPRAVEKNIAKLKQKGLLKRIGPAKGGYWEVKI